MREADKESWELFQRKKNEWLDYWKVSKISNSNLLYIREFWIIDHISVYISIIKVCTMCQLVTDLCDVDFKLLHVLKLFNSAGGSGCSRRLFFLFIRFISPFTKWILKHVRYLSVGDVLPGVFTLIKSMYCRFFYAEVRSKHFALLWIYFEADLEKLDDEFKCGTHFSRANTHICLVFLDLGPRFHDLHIGVI